MLLVSSFFFFAQRGPRVQIAAYLEQEMGFTNVTRLEGGIVSYSKFAKERGLESKFKVSFKPIRRSPQLQRFSSPRLIR